MKVGAEFAGACYSGGMRRNRADTGTITGIAEATAERVRLSGEILKAMAEAMARNRQIQQRFVTHVSMKLARIEALLEQVHVRNLARDQRPFHYYEDKLMEHARGWPSWVCSASVRFSTGSDFLLKMASHLRAAVRSAADPPTRASFELGF